MKLTLLLAAAAAAATFMAAPAGAKSGPQAKHDRDVIRFFAHHPKLAATPAGARAAWTVLGHMTDRLRELQTARAVTAEEPAHLALWKCIAGYPGSRPGGGSGESGGNPAASNGSHFNVLQMTDPWEGIHPIGLPADRIMELAEDAYARHGYSHGWLSGQWGETIGPCWQFS